MSNAVIRAVHNRRGGTSDLLYIIAATHALARSVIKHYGLPNGSWKTITQAYSLRGLRPDARIVFRDSSLEFPDKATIMIELKRRFTNVTYLDCDGRPIDPRTVAGPA